MSRGVRFLSVAFAAAAAGCASDVQDVRIRPSGTAALVQADTVAGKLGQAHSQLALGNTGLALELFRNALRSSPGNVEAQIGLALSYDRMGRFDLSRRYFETSLAAAPSNVALLTLFATSLQQQGKMDEARAVKEEIASLLQQTKWATFVAAAGASSTMKLPPARSTSTASPAVSAEINTSKERSVASHAFASTSRLTHQSPRLERLSHAEVILLTVANSSGFARVALSEAPPAMRFVPLRGSQLKPRVRLLNAARSHRLAGRAREYLAERGWRRLMVGDAAVVRATSIIYYPEHDRQTAEILGAQFGFRIQRRVKGHSIVVLLGRDAAQAKALKRSS